MLIHQPYVDFVLRYADNHPALRENEMNFAFYCFNDARKVFPELSRDDEDRGPMKSVNYDISMAHWFDSYVDAVVTWNCHNEDKI